jgi:hypothetical protein
MIDIARAEQGNAVDTKTRPHRIFNTVARSCAGSSLRPTRAASFTRRIPQPFRERLQRVAQASVPSGVRDLCGESPPKRVSPAARHTADGRRVMSGSGPNARTFSMKCSRAHAIASSVRPVPSRPNQVHQIVAPRCWPQRGRHLSRVDLLD